MRENLFMYGTLMPGQPNHHHVQDIPGEWQCASVRGFLYPDGIGLATGYPALVPAADGPVVKGWMLASDALAGHWQRLDAFEGFAYRRVMLPVRLETGESVDAHVYVLAESDR